MLPLSKSHDNESNNISIQTVDNETNEIGEEAGESGEVIPTNHEPIWDSELTNIEIEKNKNVTINLDEHFYDEDNDALSYSSSQPDDINVLINNNFITLVPFLNFIGLRTINFFASDTNSIAASDEISVNIIDTKINEIIKNETQIDKTGKPIEDLEVKVNIDKNLRDTIVEYLLGGIDPDNPITVDIYFSNQVQDNLIRDIQKRYNEQTESHRNSIKNILQKYKLNKTKEEENNPIAVRIDEYDLVAIFNHTKEIKNIEKTARNDIRQTLTVGILQEQQPFVDYIESRGGVIINQLKSYNMMTVKINMWVVEDLINNNEIASGIAQADGEWMTTEFVPFKSILNFDKSSTTAGRLIFKKDNPSGLSENDAVLVKSFSKKNSADAASSPFTPFGRRSGR